MRNTAHLARFMFIDFLTDNFFRNQDSDAIIWRESGFSYGWIMERIKHWQNKIQQEQITAGTVAIVEGDFSPNSISLFLALVEAGCIIVPLSQLEETKKNELIEIAQGEVLFKINENDDVQFSRLTYEPEHPFYTKLSEDVHPGLVVFSSGSSGTTKAAVHDLAAILKKFHIRRNCLRSIAFLLYDHLGGLNTMLYQLSNCGCIVTLDGRDPDDVLAAVERHTVELLPTSPTFINLILLSEAYKRHD